MPAQQASWPTHAYATYYNMSAEHPEHLKYPRFGDHWFKKLSDDVYELRKLETELNCGVADMFTNDNRTMPNRRYTILDCPRHFTERENYKDLHEKWLKMENLRRTYSQDLCLVIKLFQLPHPTKYGTSRLEEMEGLFANGKFGPTDEADRDYRNPHAPDFVSIVKVDSTNLLAELIIKNRCWIYKLTVRPLRKLFRRGPEISGMQLADIIAFADTLACVFFPCLLTATMFALARVPSIKVRIAVVGVFGLIFSVLAQLQSGPGLARGQIISITAAYFAVASVFVSAPDARTSKCT